MLGVIVYTLGRGSETYIARHIDELAPGRTVVCSLAPCERPSWAPRAPALELHAPRRRAVRALRRLLQPSAASVLRLDRARLAIWLIKNDVKVVLCEYLQVAVSIIDVCRALRIPVVAHAHGYDITALPRQPGWRERYARVLPLMDEIVVVSDDMRRKVLAFGVDPKRVHVIACGTVVPAAAAAEIRDTRKTRYKALAVGRLMPKKGPIYLLEAFRLIRQSVDTIELFVIGDGPLREAMSQFIDATGLGSVVHLLGPLPNDQVRAHLRDSDLFLQHSVTAEDGDEEGLPVAILEAMAESVPVVSTAHAGIPEIVRDGVTGFVVAPGDSRAMARRSLELLADEGFRSRIRIAARRLVCDEFTTDREYLRLRGVLAKYWPDCGERTGDSSSANATEPLEVSVSRTA